MYIYMFIYMYIDLIRKMRILLFISKGEHTH